MCVGYAIPDMKPWWAIDLRWWHQIHQDKCRLWFKLLPSENTILSITE